MSEAWLCLCPSECLIKKIVERKRRKPLLAADYLSDLHEVVVHDVGEVVCWKLVSPLPEHLVVECVCVYLYMSADEVIHLHDPVLRHLEADSPVCAGLEELLPLCLRHRKGVAKAKTCCLVVDECLTVCLHLSALCTKLFSCVECIVCISSGNELLGILAVDRLSLALSVRCMRMTL